MRHDVPEGEEVLDLLLAGGLANILDVDSSGRHLECVYEDGLCV